MCTLSIFYPDVYMFIFSLSCVSVAMVTSSDPSYIPLGVLERVPQKINERPPAFRGRDPLETIMASNDCRDWVKIR